MVIAATSLTANGVEVLTLVHAVSHFKNRAAVKMWNP
jgi:hypothetical protein